MISILVVIPIQIKYHSSNTYIDGSVDVVISPYIIPFKNRSLYLVSAVYAGEKW